MPRWLLFGCLAAMLALIAILWWRGDQALRAEAARHVLIEERRSAAMESAVRTCLDEGNPLLSDGWGRLKAAPDTRRTRSARHRMQIDISDRGDHRRVRIYTANGRPLDASERALFDRCLAA